MSLAADQAFSDNFNKLVVRKPSKEMSWWQKGHVQVSLTHNQNRGKKLHALSVFNFKEILKAEILIY